MLAPMTFRVIALSLLSATSFLICSCGSDDEVPLLMAGNTQVASDEGEKIYQKAKQADGAGNTGKAIRLYDQVATKFPFAPSAAQARFRQAQLLEERGDIEKSFEAYDMVLKRYQGSGLYTTAYKRQVTMAQSAADGDVKSSMMGFKTKLSLDKTVAMLGKVRDNAPKSAEAAKAQFTIGQLYEGKKKPKEAIAAYRQLVSDQPGSAQAPTALFRVGVLLTADADRGNQNQANLDLAREAFNDYLIQYPGDSNNAEARRLLDNLGGRDIQRSYDVAEFYQKTGKSESAKVYYRDVMARAKSGPLYEKARSRLKELGE
jgi:outer membrane protein assembly factor BamD (BamD/ComL family)